MLDKILTTVVTVLVSLIITLFFNLVVNLPKKKRQLKTKEDEDRKQFIETLESMKKNDEKIYEELRKQSETYKDVKEDLQLCKLGLQAVIKNTLKTRYEKWIEEGYAPLDAKDDLERMYQVYHKLGANGVMDSLRKKFLALPDNHQK